MKTKIHNKIFNVNFLTPELVITKKTKCNKIFNNAATASPAVDSIVEFLHLSMKSLHK